MNRRGLASFLVLLTVALLVGACGGSDQGTAAGDEGTTQDATAQEDGGGDKGAVAMSFAGADIALWNDELELMRPQIEAAGYEFLTHDPQWKIEKQVQDWEAWIARGDVKAIMGWPIQVDALIPVTAKANEAGIPVIGYAVGWEGTAANLLTKPIEDGNRLGHDAAEWILENYGDEPVEVAVLSDRQNDLTRGRVDGILQSVEEGAPNATVYEVPALSRDEGFTAAKQHLTAHPDTVVWLSFSDDNMKGVYQALLDSGVAKDDPGYFLAGMDVTNETLDYIKVPNSIYRQAYAFTSTELANANVDLLLAAAEGEALEDYHIDAQLVTAENADEFYVGDRAKDATTTTS